MKILYVTTVSGTINAFLIPHIKMLIDLGHTVDIACNITSPINSKIINYGCKVNEIKFSRSPLSTENIEAYKEIKAIIKNEEYDLVHTHTPVASFITRLACKKIPSIKVLYTAHGFHFYKGAPIKNWIIYYPIEKWLSKETDVLITMNKEDYHKAKKSFSAKEVRHIPGVGLDIEKFKNIVVDIKSKRKQLGLLETDFTMLSVGELNTNKNHETVIRALATLKNPNIHYLICGKGNLEGYLKDLVNQLGLEKQVQLLGFREDIAEMCKMSDLFIFPSLREGLPVSLMEAMATGLPVVCSEIRGSSDLIKDGYGGYLVKSDDIDGFSNAINKLHCSVEKRAYFANNNVKSIKKYSTENILKDMERIYLNLNRR